MRPGRGRRATRLARNQGGDGRGQVVDVPPRGSGLPPTTGGGVGDAGAPTVSLLPPPSSGRSGGPLGKVTIASGVPVGRFTPPGCRLMRGVRTRVARITRLGGGARIVSLRKRCEAGGGASRGRLASRSPTRHVSAGAPSRRATAPRGGPGGRVRWAAIDTPL